MKIVVPLSKSPSPHKFKDGLSLFNRTGPVQVQDWYRALLKAIKLADEEKLTIWIVTDTKLGDAKAEWEVYMDALKHLNFPEERILVLRKGTETIGQIEAISAAAPDAEVVLIATWLHYLRVKYLVRGTPVKVKIAWGLPRWSEAITDVVLTILFPLVDLIGFRDRFLQLVNKRRAGGKL